MNIYSAPLQGLTDREFRETHRAVFGGVTQYFTPFIRFDRNGGLRNKDYRDITITELSEGDIPQILPKDAAEFHLYMEEINKLEHKRVDINMGCPFVPVVKSGRGVGLYSHLEEMEAIVDAISEYKDIRFSIKTRLGYSSGDEILKLIPLFNRAPLEMLTIHGRIGVQQYKGSVDMESFKHALSQLEVPVVYNGDINSVEDYLDVVEQCPSLLGVMIGRGLVANPSLPLDIISSRSDGEADSENRVADREKLLVFHNRLLESYELRLQGEHQILTKMKSLWDYFLPDCEKKLRKKVIKSRSIAVYKRSAEDAMESWVREHKHIMPGLV